MAFLKKFDNLAIKSYKSASSEKGKIKFKRREYAYIKETHYKEPDCYSLC
jgi:hypothetical protein